MSSNSNHTNEIADTVNIIYEAFNALLEENSFKSITVNDIINQANISRSTFYRHFEDKYTLFVSMCQHFYDGVYDSSDTLKDYSVNVLRMYREHIKVFINLLSMNTSVIMYDDFSNALIEQSINNYLRNKPDKNYDKGISYAINIWCRGYIEAIRVWINDGCPYPEEEFFIYLNEAMPKPIYNQFDYCSSDFANIRFLRY